MISLTMKEVIEAVSGTVRGEPPRGNVRGVSTDSRTTGEGELFFALRGPNFDGHAYVHDALERGAAGAVVAAGRDIHPNAQRQQAPEGDALAIVDVRDRALAGASRSDAGRAANDTTVATGLIIEVDSPLAALGRIASYHRQQLSASVIAVAGSNGKTTTKAMIDHILAGRFKGRCSPKSFNNEIGVPLTLLSADRSDDYLVVEIGTNAPGEIAALAKLTQPDMAVLTCIGEEHLEKLGDLAGVAAEECAILAALPNGAFAAVNVDAPEVRGHLPRPGVTIVTFGRSDDADMRLTDTSFVDGWLHFAINGKFKYRLPLAGAHNASNAAGAIAVARRLGLDHDEIAGRLETFAAPPMRTEILTVGGVTLINDAYNANPPSALAAIDALESLPASGRRIAVFGEMRELGSRSAELHRRVAERLRGSAVNHVLLVGAAEHWMGEWLSGQPGLFGPALDACESVDDCAARLAQIVKAGDVVLLKASRAVGLERIVEPLRQRLAQP